MDALADVKVDVAAYVGDSGACADDPRVIEGINTVRRILYPLGDWKDITEAICIKPNCGRITLPPHLDYAKKAFMCCVPITVNNDWFTPVSNFDTVAGAPCASFIKEAGSFVTFRDFPVTPRAEACCNPNGFRLKVVFEDAADVGTVLTFQAVGVHKHKVSLTRTCEAAWIPAEAGPKDEWITQLTYVVKPRTQGRIRVFGTDGENPDVLLALYDPDVVNPQMTRYQTGLRAVRNVVLKAKKRFVKLTDDNQPVDIATDALIHGLQALTDRQNRNIVGFNANIKMAKDYLNAELAGPESTAAVPMRMSGAYRVTGLIE